MTQFHCSLYDLDRTDIETLFRFSGYAMRKDAGKTGGENVEKRPIRKQEDTMRIGGKVYRRVSADRATWL